MMRRAGPSDLAQIVEVGAEVYSQLGDYRAILPTWLSHPGVEAYVEVAAQSPSEALRGFILLCFETWSVGERPALGSGVVDLLAIAVAPPHQRQGLGKKLLGYAINRARTSREPPSARELRLTVAADNKVARHLFSSAGFEILDAHHGSYDRGQRAIRMRLPLR